MSFTVTGTFGAVISGSDPLKLSGSPFSMTGAIGSGATKPYVIPSLMLTLGSGSGSITVTLTNVPLTLTPGNPAQVTIAASVIGQPFTAVVNLSPGFTVSYPYPFGTQPIAAGSTVNYSTAPGTTLAIGGSVTASTTAPSLSFSPSSFTYAYTIGGSVPPSQNLTVTSSGAAASFQATSPDAWVVIPSGSHATGTPVAISVDPTKITNIAAGTYHSTITLNSVTGVLPQNSTIPVSLVVSAGLPTITPSPSSLTFNYQLLQTPPAGQTVTLNGGAGLSYTTSGAPTWLTVSASGTTPGPVNVSLNTAGLTAGTLNGSFNINLTGAANATINIPVTANITAAPTLSSPTSTLTYTYQVGAAAPTGQSVSVNASGGAAIPFTVVAAVTTPSGGNWLSAGAGGTTPGSVNVSAAPGSLGPGTYNGMVTISSAQASNSVVIPVTFTVTAPTLGASPSPLNFSYQLGQGAPAAQMLSVTASGSGGASAIAYTTSGATVPPGGSWLVVGSGGTTPGSVSVSINTTGLTAGTYNGSVTVSATQSSNGSVNIPVTLTVTSQPVLVPAPASLSFNYQIGGSAPASQSLGISVSGGPSVAFTVAASTTTGGSWLSALPTGGNTPGSTSVSVNTSGLAAGVYNGNVTVTASGVGNSPLSVPVTLTVSSAPTLSAVPSSFTFSYTSGGTVPKSQALAVNASGGASLSFTLNSSASWLSATPSTGTTNSTAVNLSVNPSGMPAGVYNGTITINATGAANSGLTVPVMLTITSAPSLTVTPGILHFVFQSGGTAPPAQALSVTSSTALSYTVSANTNSGGNWLSAGPAGTTPGTVMVQVATTGLAAGTYTGSVAVAAAGASNSPQVVTVDLTVSSSPLVSSTPGSVNFAFTQGGTAPAPQQIAIASTSSALNFTVASSATWLSVNPGSGTTPANLTVTADPTSLTPGTYTGTLMITASGASNSPLSVKATIVVSAAKPTINAVSDAASNLQGTISAGSIVSIWGSAFGPATPVSFTVQNGSIGNELANTQVFFNDTAATLLMVSSTQINAIVPFGVTGPTVTVKVTYQGTDTNTTQVNVAPSSPAIFTSGMNGTGQGAILNQDYSINGSTQAAAKESIVMVFGEGGGDTNPAGVDGEITPAILAPLLLPVTAQVDGVDAKVTFAGAAPELVSGVMQVNVQIPATVHSGDVSIVLSVGGVPSQSGVTVAVQ